MISLRKTIIMVVIYFCFGVQPSMAGDKIDIDLVPWTDACYFWSMEGKRLPVFNKNLMGNKLSIGGVKYDKGIAGHTPFSVVYNISGEALSFSAIVGVDDEAHPRDSKKIKRASVEIQIIVDREIVKRLTVVLGQKGIPIEIDLRGKHQVELRGVYKTGFHKQRVDFVNARFEVKDRDTFLQSAKAWQQKVKDQLFRKVEYPDAPEWKRVRIKRVKYRNWDNAYELSNNKCSVIVVPEYGGRILKFALKNRENVLFQGKNPTDANLYKRGIDISAGGNFSRPQPRNYFSSMDPILAYGEYTVEFPREGELVMTSAYSWYFGLQYIYRVKLHDDAAKVTVTTTHKNIAGYSHKAGVWSLTRISTSKASASYMPKEISNPYRKFQFETAELFDQVEIGKDSNFDVFRITPSFLAKKRTSVEWQNFPSVNVMKVLMKNDKAQVNNSLKPEKSDEIFFVKTFDYQESMNPYMKDFYPAHFYIYRSFIEVETHGPTKLLEPDGEISWRENWELKKELMINN